MNTFSAMAYIRACGPARQYLTAFASASPDRSLPGRVARPARPRSLDACHSGVPDGAISLRHSIATAFPPRHSVTRSASVPVVALPHEPGRRAVLNRSPGGTPHGAQKAHPYRVVCLLCLRHMRPKEHMCLLCLLCSLCLCPELCLETTPPHWAPSR